MKLTSIFHVLRRYVLRSYVLRFTFLTLLLTSCAPLVRPTLGTATPPPPTSTPLQTPTPIWFPPTDTPPAPAASLATSTPDFSPGLGRVLYSDDFTKPANWSTPDLVLDGELALGASPDIYQMSLHKELLVTDFYAEITAHLSLCRGADEYGLLVRAIPAAYYRFALNCNGEIKVDRIVSGARVPLQESTLSIDAPRGGPSDVTLAVWAVGREMRFFLNGHYQFTVSDPVMPTGTLGVFVRGSQDDPVTVSFSDLVVYEVKPNP